MREELVPPWASALFARLAPEGLRHPAGTAVEVSDSFGANEKKAPSVGTAPSSSAERNGRHTECVGKMPEGSKRPALNQGRAG